MIKLKKVLAGAMAATMMFAVVGCSMVEKTEEGIKKSVVAKVYKQKITLGEVDENLELVLKQVVESYGKDYAKNEQVMKYVIQQRTAAVNDMIDDKIYAVKAKELNIMPTEEDLKGKADEELAKWKSSYKSEEEFQEGLKQSGYTEEQLIENLKLSIVFKTVYEEATKDVTVTDEQVKKYYEENKNSYTEKINRINPAHILVKDEAVAKEIIEKLNGGADFAQLAAEYGTDGTKDKGGELGWIEYNSDKIDKTFLLAAIATEKGAYTPTPVQTQFGFHVIKCLDKEEYPVKEFETVKEEVQKTALDEAKYTKWTETLKDWRDSADIKLYEKELKQ